MNGHFESIKWNTPMGPMPVDVFFPDHIAESDPSLSSRTIAAILEAEHALSELENLLTQEDIAPLAGLFVEIEAIASSAIEDYRVSYPELANSLLLGRANQTVRLVMGNYMAIQTARELSQRPLSTSDLLNLHAALLAGTIGDSIAGKLRSGWVWIGSRSPVNAIYVAPPSAKVPELLDDLALYCNRTDLPAVFQAAVAHAQYETIHPHGDGNGRTGRALIHNILARRGLVSSALAPLSVSLWNERSDYYLGLAQYREGEMDAWCTFFANSVSEGAALATHLCQQFLPLRDSWQEKTASLRKDSAALTLLRSLPNHPLLQQSQAQLLTNASDEATRLAIHTLVDAKILAPTTSPTQRHLWAVPDLFRLVGNALSDSALAPRSQREL